MENWTQKAMEKFPFQIHKVMWPNLVWDKNPLQGVLQLYNVLSDPTIYTIIHSVLELLLIYLDSLYSFPIKNVLPSSSTLKNDHGELLLPIFVPVPPFSPRMRRFLHKTPALPSLVINKGRRGYLQPPVAKAKATGQASWRPDGDNRAWQANCCCETSGDHLGFCKTLGSRLQFFTPPKDCRNLHHQLALPHLLLESARRSLASYSHNNIHLPFPKRSTSYIETERNCRILILRKHKHLHIHIPKTNHISIYHWDSV